jgi:hypothetical protein
MIDIVEELLHLVRSLLAALVMGALKARATTIAWGRFLGTKWVDILTSQEHTKSIGYVVLAAQHGGEECCSLRRGVFPCCRRRTSSFVRYR